MAAPALRFGAAKDKDVEQKKKTFMHQKHSRVITRPLLSSESTLKRKKVDTKFEEVKVCVLDEFLSRFYVDARKVIVLRCISDYGYITAPFESHFTTHWGYGVRILDLNRLILIVRKIWAPPWGSGGFKSRMCPPYPHACRKYKKRPTKMYTPFYIGFNLKYGHLRISGTEPSSVVLIQIM